MSRDLLIKSAGRCRDITTRLMALNADLGEKLREHQHTPMEGIYGLVEECVDCEHSTAIKKHSFELNELIGNSREIAKEQSKCISELIEWTCAMSSTK